MHGRTPKHRSSPVATLGEGELLRLGEWVRDVSLTLGGGSLTDPMEAMLFHEALTDAIDTLSARQSMREAMQKHSGYEDISAPALSISLEDSAQQIIDRAFADGFSGPPPEAERAARIHFALKPLLSPILPRFAPKLRPWDIAPGASPARNQVQNGALRQQFQRDKAF